MSRIRSDKPEAYQSESLAEISVPAERTFKGMATLADDHGRLPDKPAQINGELWSMRGEHSKDDLEAELVEMADVNLICRYTGCDGKKYLHFVTWYAHQKIDRPSKSRLPRCQHHRNPVADRDLCGRHEGECSRREVSGALHNSGDNPREDSMQSREGSRASDYDSMLDLGPRTVDLGFRTEDLNRSAEIADVPRADGPSLAADDRAPLGAALFAVDKPGPGADEGEAKPKRGRPVRPSDDPLFAEWYAAYPVHKARGDAERAWAKALASGATPRVLIDAAKRYCDDPNVLRGFGKHPATWLNAQCWLDEAAPAQQDERRGHQTYRNPADDSVYEEKI